VELAMKIRLREVHAFGETPLAGKEPDNDLLRRCSNHRRLPGSFGERTSVYEDGPTRLYGARCDGDGFALLGQEKQMFDDAVLLKVGISNHVKRRQPR
jgi:hypothetical protein